MESKKENVDVFLCHNRADKDWVRQLAEQIESETLDGTSTGRTLRVFFDEWDIDIGQNVLLRINQALTVTRYLAVVISPELLEAQWPALEWTHVVADDPTNRKGRIIPLFLRDYSAAIAKHAELPAPFKALNWIDFRKLVDFKTGFQKLVRKLRDQPPMRGRRRPPLASSNSVAMPLHSPSMETSADPDRVSDLVLGNLLPVEDYPKTIWYAPTDARVPKEIRDIVSYASPFILEDKKLFTFADLSRSDEPIRKAVDVSKIDSRPVGEWKDDPVRWRWVVALLNRCIRGHFGGLPIKRDNKGRYFFRPKDNEKRSWKNGDDPERTVADRKIKASGEAFWVHHGTRLSFVTLGDRLFLCVDPCYVFTSNGDTPLEGRSVGPLSIKWGGKERNAAILRHVVFWARTLARRKSKIELATGGNPVLISGVPALARTSFGIEFDHIGFGALLEQVEDELDLAASTLEMGVISYSTDDDGHGTEEVDDE